jgi:hypothetical protein
VHRPTSTPAVGTGVAFFGAPDAEHSMPNRAFLAARSRRPPFTTIAITAIIASAIAATLAAVAPRAAAQDGDVGPNKPETVFNRGAFRFAAPARSELHELWRLSVAAGEERVACIGGDVRDSVVYITRVERLAPDGADRGNISAVASLRKCAPPDWFGTVHTHIATMQGYPIILFSGADRGVMQLWRRQWHERGVFCLLYSDSEANCEAGNTLSGYAFYSHQRGNTILF